MKKHDHPHHDHSHDDHDHGHGHGHAHGGHGHSHAPASFGRAFVIGIGLNIAFVAVEAGYGLYANSMALLADAGHNLSDVLGLVVAFTAVILARRKASARFTYGLGSSSILAALFNAAFLLVAVGVIGWEAVLRFVNPQPVAGGIVMGVAAVGILINGITAWLFARGRKGDLNIRGAYLHMLADAAVSLGVVVAGFIIYLTGWLWLDPAISLVIAALIIYTTWGLFRDSLHLSLAAVPPGVDTAAVRHYLASLKGVADVHDLHIWPLSTTQTALTCHLVIPAGHPGDAFLMRVATSLKEHFAINHATIQVEKKVDENGCFMGDCGA